jgi:hypothetical protein
VTPAAVRSGAETWAALNHRHPRELIPQPPALAALPFLPAALRRYRGISSTRNGLSRRSSLRPKRSRGAHAHAAFVAVQEREQRPFLGDGTFYAVLRDLASGITLLAGSRRNLAKLGDAELRQCELCSPPWANGCREHSGLVCPDGAGALDG